MHIKTNNLNNRTRARRKSLLWKLVWRDRYGNVGGGFLLKIKHSYPRWNVAAKWKSMLVRDSSNTCSLLAWGSESLLQTEVPLSAPSCLTPSHRSNTNLIFGIKLHIFEFFCQAQFQLSSSFELEMRLSYSWLLQPTHPPRVSKRRLYRKSLPHFDLSKPGSKLLEKVAATKTIF